MLDKLTNTLDFQSKALVLRADRQRVIAGNIANADTPGYAARSVDFASALRAAGTEGGGTGGGTLALSGGADGRTHSRHLPLGGAGSMGAATSTLDMAEAGSYATQTQPTLDGNSVDLDRERAAFADNAVRYEATLRFINGQGKTLLSAIQGQ